METQNLTIIKSKVEILLRFLLLSLLHQIATAKLTDQELDTALISLRSHGYTLFPNAISTSDLRLQLLNQSRNATSPSTFTLFSPPNSLLSSLDLASSAPHYTKSLSLHVSTSRLSLSDLRNLTSSSSAGAYIDSLVPGHRLLINNSLVHSNAAVSVNRVPVLVPDLFLGSCIAVHGLNGILVAGFDDRVEDTSFTAATSSLADAIWSPELSSPPARGPYPRSRRQRNQRNHHKRGNNKREGSDLGGRGAANAGGGRGAANASGGRGAANVGSGRGAADVGSCSGGRGVWRGGFAKYNHNEF